MTSNYYSVISKNHYALNVSIFIFTLLGLWFCPFFGFGDSTPGPNAGDQKQTPTPVLTPSPTKTNVNNSPPVKTPGPFANPKNQLPRVTTIPNPAWGDKVIFRVMTQGPSQVQIIIYDRLFNKVKELGGNGESLFDIIWDLKKIPEGIYYYQTRIVDTGSGKSQILKMQSFVILNDKNAPPEP
jgi:aryl-phospho-beta-D-glucosidase BglC (GH1 family)